jgi:hypothetical protein
MVPHEPLQDYLTEQGITWDVVSDVRHWSLEAKWQSIYGDVWRLGMRHKQGQKAQGHYAAQVASEFLIVPFLGDVAGPHSIGDHGPVAAAYQCRGDGRLPDLSQFTPSVDFFVIPPDFNWTMVHTHEDHEFGGPYFIQAEWLTPPTRRRH